MTARYTLLTGPYGSGKTELSLALIRHFRKHSAGRVALVDLDIVNPYFRGGEQKEALTAEGIEVLMPSFALSAVDIPALPADIQRIFDTEYDRVVIDVGGDDTGAAALGRYFPEWEARREQMQTLYVINPLRPFSAAVNDIAAMFGLIGSRARLRPDCLVNNANLQGETTARHLIDAQALLEKVSGQLCVPVGMVAGEERLRAQLPPAMRRLFFPIVPVMKPGWLEDAP